MIGIGGSSGSIYARLLMERLREMPEQWDEVGVVMSANAELNWKLELGAPDWSAFPFRFYDKQDFFAPFASGSARYGTMIVCPCSMGLLARIASGHSQDLLTRAADVMLKERRRLLLVPRETPYNLIHLRNMVSLTEAGAIIAPASPSFYANPADMYALALTVVDRLLDLAGLDVPSYRWGENPEP